MSSTKSNGSETEPEARLRHRLEHGKEFFEAGGVELPGISTLFLAWKKFGIKGLLFIVLFIGIPTGEYSVLRYAVYSGLPRTVGGFGASFSAEEWSISPLRLRAVARNVKVSASGGQPIFTAGEVEFAGSVWTLLRGLPDMVTFHVFGWRQPFNEIVIRHGNLHLERSLSGRLNWSELVAAVPRARFDEAMSGVYRIHELTIEDSRVRYIEHLPGGTADGIFRSAQAEVTLEQLNGSITDLEPPEEPGSQPTRFVMKGRSASGVFEVSGSGALLVGAPDITSDKGARAVRASNSEPVGGGHYEASIYLENIAAAAYGQMVPITTIVPINGTINGKTTVLVRNGELECRGAFTMKEVRFAPNREIVTDPQNAEVVSRLLVNLVYSGPFELCQSEALAGAGSGSGAAAERPAAYALSRLTEQATADASPGVKALVDRDRRIISGETVETSLSTLTDNLAREMGIRLATKIAGTSGQAVAQSLSEDGQSSGGRSAGKAVLGGVKSVGSGIKRVFGGGKKRK